MNNSEQVKEYVRPSLLSPAVFIIFSLVLLFRTIGNQNTEIIIIALVIGSVGFVPAYMALNRLSNQFKKFEHDGELEKVVNDFQNAAIYADGNLKLGHSYVFGNKSGRVLQYEDIDRVYQYVHKTNFAEDRRELRASTKDNRIYTLCRLKRGPKLNDELNKILAIISKKNPNVKFGYK